MVDKSFDYLISIANGQKARAPEELREVVRDCLQKLPELQKNVLLLHFWESKGVDEIAYELKRRKDTIAKALKEGLETMKTHILNELDLEEVVEEVEIEELATVGAI